ncbi:MAG TPA: hypothetical protein VK430_02400 [Xanthobacteraceae bacterium]|nr:hypothetical protein [Xanthobacteraceae bacterium]
MRIVVMAVAAIALLTIPAQAQRAPPYQNLPTKDDPSDHASRDEKPAVKADEKAYQSALQKIPQAKNSDPWASVRQAPQAK